MILINYLTLKMVPMPKHRRSIIFSCRLYSCLMFLFLLLMQNAHALLTPEPQKVIYGTKSDSVKITSQWEIVFAGNDNGHIDRDALHQILAEDLQPALQQHGITLPILSTPSDKAVKGRIIIGRVGDGTFVDKLFHSSRFRTIELPYSLNDQRYRECYFFESAIDAHGNMSVFIFSYGYQGLAHGIQSLIQLIETDIDIPLVKIIDYPDMKWRGFYIDFRSYKSLGKKRINARLDQEAVDSVLNEIKHYSKYKINRIIFAGPVFDQLDEENLYYLMKIFDACRKRFIEPVPTINSLLWGKSVKNLKQQLAPFVEGVYIQNEPFVIDSNGVARPKKNTTTIISNGSFEQDSDGDNNPDGWIFGKENYRNHWSIGKARELGAESSSVKNGEKAAKLIIDRPRNYHGLALTTRIEKGLIPGSYYELNFWSRGGVPPYTRGKLTVTQIDGNRQVIKTIKNDFGFDFFAWGRYVPNWEPIFIHNECRALKLRFAPYRHGGSKGTIYIDDISLHRMNGALFNVIPPPEGFFSVTDQDGRTVYQERKDYLLKRAPYQLKPRTHLSENANARVIIPNGSRITKGQVVKISYDCLVASPMHRNSRLCPSSFGTYRYYRKQFEKLLTLAPRYINIHMSEHLGGFNRDRRCLERHMSNAELFASFVRNLAAIVQKKGPVEVLPGKTVDGLAHHGIRLFMWDDMVNYWHNGGGEKGEYFQMAYGGRPGPTYLALTGHPLPRDNRHRGEKSRVTIPKDVIIASWWYQNKDKMGILANSPRYYEEAGFDYIGTTWYRKGNIAAWSHALEGRRALGLISSCWNTNRDGIIPTADYAWKSIAKR